MRSQTEYKSSIKGMYTNAKAKAKYRNVDFVLTLNQYEKLRTQNCHYCGSKLTGNGGGLDRVNNHKGYTLKNSVPCCQLCNAFKSNLTVRQFLAHVTKIFCFNMHKIAKLYGKSTDNNKKETT